MTVEKIRAKLEQSNQTRLNLLERIEAMAPEDLTRKAGSNRWSVLEILQHIVLGERGVLHNLPEPSRLVHCRRRPIHFVKYAIVLFILKWNIPVPVPSAEMVPDGITTLEEIRDQWEQNYRWFKSYVDGLNAETVKHAVFRHPVTGPLTPGQALRMGHLHLETHIRHIKRNRQLSIE